METLIVSSRDGFLSLIKFDLEKDFGAQFEKLETACQSMTDVVTCSRKIETPEVTALEFTDFDQSKTREISKKTGTQPFFEDCSKNWEHNVEFNLDDLNDTSDEDDSEDAQRVGPSSSSKSSKKLADNPNVRRSTRKNKGQVSAATLKQRERERERNGPSWLDQTFEDESDSDFKDSESDDDETCTKTSNSGSSVSGSSDSGSESEEESSSDEDDSDTDEASDEESSPVKSMPKKQPISLNADMPSKASSSKISSVPPSAPVPEPLPFSSSSKTKITKESETQPTIDLGSDSEEEEDSGDDDFEEKENEKIGKFSSPRINSAVKRKINHFGGATQPPPPQEKPKPRRVMLKTLK